MTQIIREIKQDSEASTTSITSIKMHVLIVVGNDVFLYERKIVYYKCMNNSASIRLQV